MMQSMLDITSMAEGSKAHSQVSEVDFYLPCDMQEDDHYPSVDCCIMLDPSNSKVATSRQALTSYVSGVRQSAMEDLLAAESDRKISMSPSTFSYLPPQQVRHVRKTVCGAALTL